MNQIIFRNLLQLLLITFISYVLISVAGLRSLEYFRDTSVYLDTIHSADRISGMEPTVWLIMQINLLLLGGSDQVFFLIYAILGVSLKIYSINRMSAIPLLSIFIYICLYFILHEMTQIRVGVACGFFLLAVPDIKNRNLRLYLLKTALAVSFHYSAIVMIFLYFINSDKINLKAYYILPLAGLLLANFPNVMLDFFRLFEFSSNSVFVSKIAIYLTLLNDDDYNKINIFNFFTTSLLFFYYFMLFNIKKLNSEFDLILIKLFGIQLFIYYACSSVPTFAMRLSDFIGITLVITIPHLALIFKQRFAPIILIVFFGSGYLWFIGINRLIQF
jgi:hypothetical protein